VPDKSFYLTGDEPSDKFLEENPLALLIGMVLDQQIPMERAFSGPYVLSQRLSIPLDPQAIVNLDPEILEDVFSQKPALHRFPKAMAERVWALCEIVAESYEGDASAIWANALSGEELLDRLEGLPGFGTMKAKIFLALLAKKLKLRPEGWREAANPYGQSGVFMSVADIDSPESLVRVRAYKTHMKADIKVGE
jgi:uncharacterized HhH-GPD family protein